MAEEFRLPDPKLPPLGERTLAGVMERNLRRYPDKTALRDPQRSLTYRELNDEALRLAGGIASLGVERQQPLLLMLDNHIDYISCWIALGLTARIEVPINTAYLGSILVHVINNCGARAIIIEDHYVERLAAIANQIPRLEEVVIRGDIGQAAALPQRMRVRPYSDLLGAEPAGPEAIAPWDLIGIMYTSGTTGLSKGVRVTHAHAYGYSTPEIYGACKQDDTVLVVLPLFHIGGQWKGVYNTLIAGGTTIILPRFRATQFWDDIREYGCTYTMLLGVMAEFLYRQPESERDRDHPLKQIIMVPVMADLEGFKKRFGIEIVSSAYGSTEAAVAILSPIGGAEPGKIGWPRPDYDIRLVDENDMDVPPGKAGELVIRAREPWVIMDGYHDMPDATASAWRNLWFHTGDTMRRDERGMLIFVDRVKDAIRRRGENVSSFEVEREIMEHPAVAECAVVAVPSDATEDDIKACVVLRKDAAVSGGELFTFLQSRLPYFMIPRYFQFMDELPRTPTEKIRKQHLREIGVPGGTWDAEKAGFPQTGRRQA